MAPPDLQARQFDNPGGDTAGTEPDGELESVMDSVRTGWQFISGSYNKLRDNSVAFQALAPDNISRHNNRF